MTQSFPVRAKYKYITIGNYGYSYGFGYSISLSGDGRRIACGTYEENYVEIYDYIKTSKSWEKIGFRLSR